MSENSEIAVLKANYREINRDIKKAEANLVLIRAEYDATIKHHSAFYGPIERLRIQLASENLKGVVKSEIDSLKRKKSRAYSEIQTLKTKLKKLDEKIRSKSGNLEPYKRSHRN